MMILKKSEATAARRRIPLVLVDDTDGKTAETGVTLSAGDLKISKNGAAEANHGGTMTELAGGDYYYEATQGELDTVGYLTGRLVKSGVRTFRFAAQVVEFDPYDAAGLGLSRVDAAVSTRATQTSVDTIDDLLDTEIAAILALLDTEIATLLAAAAAIQAKTDNLPASPAATGDAMALTSAAVDAILDDATDGARTLRQLIRGIAAATMGKVSGAGTGTETFRDTNDTKNRIVTTVDDDGNRSAVTLDLT